jgi:hypothetical protein
VVLEVKQSKGGAECGVEAEECGEGGVGVDGVGGVWGCGERGGLGDFDFGEFGVVSVLGEVGAVDGGEEPGAGFGFVAEFGVVGGEFAEGVLGEVGGVVRAFAEAEGKAVKRCVARIHNLFEFLCVQMLAFQGQAIAESSFNLKVFVLGDITTRIARILKERHGGTDKMANGRWCSWFCPSPKPVKQGGGVFGYCCVKA